jgi:hypothetical protein
VAKRWQAVAKHAVAASAAAAALGARGVEAQQEVAGGGGVFFGYGFGAGSHFEWGLEAFATRTYEESSCTSTEKRWGFGGFARLSLRGLERPGLTFGAHAGGELSRGGSALTGELGGTWRFGQEGGFGIHSGVLAETLILTAAARYQWLLHEAFVGAGARIVNTYGPAGFCVVGRPLRVDAGVLVLRASPRDAAGYDRADVGSRIESVGRAFERDAQLEHASVPAFLQLAAELHAHAAPQRLVERAIDAARDEVRHAALCTQLARRHLPQTAPPVLPVIARRAPLAGVAGVERLAIESWLDGCLSEGRAAAQARRAAEIATDPEARAVMQVIADDEQRHAELAWAILRWALARGGEPAHSAVRALRDVEAAPTDELAQDDLQAHGRLAGAELDRLTAQHGEASRARLRALLANA